MKKKFNDLNQENTQLKTRISQVKKDIDKMDKLIKQGNKNYQRNAGNDFQDIAEEYEEVDGGTDNSSLKTLWQQKKQIKSIKEEIDRVDNEIRETKHAVQSFKLAQADNQIKILSNNLVHYKEKIDKLCDLQEQETDLAQENSNLRRQENELAHRNNQLIKERDNLKDEVKKLTQISRAIEQKEKEIPRLEQEKRKLEEEVVKLQRNNAVTGSDTVRAIDELKNLESELKKKVEKFNELKLKNKYTLKNMALSLQKNERDHSNISSTLSTLSDSVTKSSFQAFLQKEKPYELNNTYSDNAASLYFFDCDIMPKTRLVTLMGKTVPQYTVLQPNEIDKLMKNVEDILHNPQNAKVIESLTTARGSNKLPFDDLEKHFLKKVFKSTKEQEAVLFYLFDKSRDSYNLDVSLLTSKYGPSKPAENTTAKPPNIINVRKEGEGRRQYDEEVIVDQDGYGPTRNAEPRQGSASLIKQKEEDMSIKKRQEEELALKKQSEAKEAADLRAKQEADLKSKQETDLKAKQEADLKAKKEADRKKSEEEFNAMKKAEEDAAKKRADEETATIAKKRAEDEAAAKQRAEEEAVAKKKIEADIIAQNQIEEERRRKAEIDAQAAARKQMDEEGKRKADEEAKKKADEEARKKADEEAKKKADEEAKRKADEENKKKTDEEAKRKADEENKKKADEEVRKKAEAEALFIKQAEEQKRMRAEAEALAKKKADDDALAKKRAEEEQSRKKAEEDAIAKKNAEDELKRKSEAEAIAKKKAEDAIAKEKEDARLKAEQEAALKKKAEDEAIAKQKADQEAAAKKKAEEEARESAKLEELMKAERLGTQNKKHAKNLDDFLDDFEIEPEPKKVAPNYTADEDEDNFVTPQTAKPISQNEELEQLLHEPGMEQSAMKIQAAFRGKQDRAKLEDLKKEHQQQKALEPAVAPQTVKVDSIPQKSITEGYFDEDSRSRSRPSEASSLKPGHDNNQKANNQAIDQEDELNELLHEPGMEQSAMKIQAAFRGKQDRAKVDSMKKQQQVVNEPPKPVEPQPGKIQNSERSNFQVDNNQKNDLPNKYNGDQEELNQLLQEPGMEQSAMKIQAAFRGKQARKEVDDLKKEIPAPKQQEQVPLVKPLAEQNVQQSPNVQKPQNVQQPQNAQQPQNNQDAELFELLHEPGMEQSAMKIQAAFRGKQDRAKVEDLKKEQQKTKESAKPVQKEVNEFAKHDIVKQSPRQNNDFLGDEDEDNFDTIVDNSKPEARKPADEKDELNQLLYEPGMEQSATKIQAAFKGKQARKEVEKLKKETQVPAPIVQQQESPRPKPVEQNLPALKSEINLETVKPGEAKEVDDAAQKIQAAFRGKKDREHVERMKEESKLDKERRLNEEERRNAEMELMRIEQEKQEVIRKQEELDRKLKRESQAATKIQSRYRGNKDRDRVVSMRKTKQNFQKKKAEDVFGKYNEEQVRAAIKIQSIYRGGKDRKNIQVLKQSRQNTGAQANLSHRDMSGVDMAESDELANMEGISGLVRISLNQVIINKDVDVRPNFEIGVLVKSGDHSRVILTLRVQVELLQVSRL